METPTGYRSLVDAQPTRGLLNRATLAELLRRQDVLLFPNWTARNPLRMWSAWAIREEWVRACEKAGVAHVSAYPSTRHATAPTCSEPVRRRSSRSRFVSD